MQLQEITSDQRQPKGMCAVTSQEDIKRILRCCVEQQTKARVTVDDGEWIIVRFVDEAPQHDAFFLKSIDGIGFNLGANRLSLRFLLFDVPFLIEEGLQWVDHQTLTLARPKRISVAGKRGQNRLPLAPTSAWLEWTTTEDGHLIRAEVHDFSAKGARVRLPADHVNVPIERVFQARLSLDGSTLECVAEARYARRLRDGKSYELGLRLSGLNGTESTLTRIYLRRLLPSLYPRRDIPKSIIRDLMLESKYLSLREGCEPTDGWYAAPWKDADSMDVVYRDVNSRLLGHVSVTRAYPDTWLGHQLATLKGHEETTACRRDLYLHFATWPRLLDDDKTMLLGYFNRSKIWHQTYFESFVRWVGSSDLAVLVPWDRFERTSTNMALPEKTNYPEDVDVSPLRGDERHDAERLASLFLPPLARKAFALNADNIVGPLLKPLDVANKYDRHRHGIALRVRGNLVGLALCETGNRDFSLFNLLNTAQIYIHGDAQKSMPQAHRVLLSAVRSFYYERGVADPLVVAPPGTFMAEAEPGTFLAETMGCIVWSGPSLMHYENFVRFYFGQFIATRQSVALGGRQLTRKEMNGGNFNALE